MHSVYYTCSLSPNSIIHIFTFFSTIIFTLFIFTNFTITLFLYI